MPLLIVGGVAGVAFLVAAFRRGQVATAAPGKCDSNKAAQAVAGEAVGGATAGVGVGPIGAGIGAGVGTGLALAQIASSPCGAQWSKHIRGQIHAIGQDACRKADGILAALHSKGVATPIGYDHLSCDQKLAAVVALASPLGLIVAGTDELVSTAVDAAKTVSNDVNQAVSGAESAASSAAKRIGL